MKTRDLVAVAVHLDADAVELALDAPPAPIARERLVDVGARARRASAAPAARPPARTARSAAAPPASAAAATAAEVAAQHRAPGAPRRAARSAACATAVEHHALERALAQLAGEQAAQEALLVGGRAAEQRGQRVAPRRLRAGARRCAADRVERGVDLGDASASARPPARGRSRSERPADADAPLAQLAATGRPRRPPPRPGPPPQRPRQRARSSRCARGSPHGLRGGGEIGEQHRPIVAGRRTNVTSANAPRYVSTPLAFCRGRCLKHP